MLPILVMDVQIEALKYFVNATMSVEKEIDAEGVKTHGGEGKIVGGS